MGWAEGRGHGVRMEYMGNGYGIFYLGGRISIARYV